MASASATLLFWTVEGVEITTWSEDAKDYIINYCKKEKIVRVNIFSFMKFWVQQGISLMPRPASTNVPKQALIIAWALKQPVVVADWDVNPTPDLSVAREMTVIVHLLSLPLSGQSRFFHNNKETHQFYTIQQMSRDLKHPKNRLKLQYKSS